MNELSSTCTFQKGGQGCKFRLNGGHQFLGLVCTRALQGGTLSYQIVDHFDKRGQDGDLGCIRFAKIDPVLKLRVAFFKELDHGAVVIMLATRQELGKATILVQLDFVWRGPRHLAWILKIQNSSKLAREAESAPCRSARVLGLRWQKRYP
jgi:hypothetical protein